MDPTRAERTVQKGGVRVTVLPPERRAGTVTVAGGCCTTCCCCCCCCLHSLISLVGSSMSAGAARADVSAATADFEILGIELGLKANRGALLVLIGLTLLFGAGLAGAIVVLIGLPIIQVLASGAAWLYVGLQTPSPNPAESREAVVVARRTIGRVAVTPILVSAAMVFMVMFIL